jgi:hypothetical protein|tara:strand:- start:2122 stop:2751 length:630 start_codon:yes stop_codon:yes gene_type:complete
MATKTKNAATATTVATPTATTTVAPTMPAATLANPYPNANGAMQACLQSFANTHAGGNVANLVVVPNLKVLNTTNPALPLLPTGYTGNRAVNYSINRGFFIMACAYGVPLVPNTANGKVTENSTLQPYSISHPAYKTLGKLCPAKWVATAGNTSTFNVNAIMAFGRTGGLTDSAQLIFALLLNGGNATAPNHCVSGQHCISIAVAPTVS